MINQKSLKAVEKARFDHDFYKPLYDSYCFSRIPATVHELLTNNGEGKVLPKDTFVQGAACDIVVLILIDGFGWRFFDHYLPKYPFLQWLENEGIASKLTAQFPSTTAAHVTCMHTGLPVGESGVYEWFYYEPKVDSIISPLLTSFAGDKGVGTLESTGIDLSTLYPAKTIYQRFKEQGIHSYILQPINIAHSPYSQAMCKDALYVPYHHFPDALDDVIELIDTCPDGEKRYICLYYGEIDSAGHRSGLFSPEYEKTVSQTMDMLEKRLRMKLPQKAAKTAFLLTADHGMTEIVPKDTFYINKEIPELIPFLKKNRAGIPIAPAGSCRDFFLHVEEKYLDHVEELLKKRLGGMAWVVRTSELIQNGFFGTTSPSQDFLSRVGNLVLMPFGHGSIWWYEKNRFEQNFFAMHGGLTKEEIEIPLLFMGDVH